MALISEKLIDKMSIPVIQHESPIALYNFTGDLVPEAGQKHTKPVLLQHRRHFTREVFEVSPLEPGVDVFLPFW
jgi:hypothetical protein